MPIDGTIFNDPVAIAATLATYCRLPLTPSGASARQRQLQLPSKRGIAYFFY